MVWFRNNELLADLAGIKVQEEVTLQMKQEKMPVLLGLVISQSIHMSRVLFAQAKRTKVSKDEVEQVTHDITWVTSLCVLEQATFQKEFSARFHLSSRLWVDELIKTLRDFGVAHQWDVDGMEQRSFRNTEFLAKETAKHWAERMGLPEEEWERVLETMETDMQRALEHLEVELDHYGSMAESVEDFL